MERFVCKKWDRDNYICPKVTKMGSIIGLWWSSSGSYPEKKLTQVPPPPPPPLDKQPALIIILVCLYRYWHIVRINISWVVSNWRRSSLEYFVYELLFVTSSSLILGIFVEQLTLICTSFPKFLVDDKERRVFFVRALFPRRKWRRRKKAGKSSDAKHRERPGTSGQSNFKNPQKWRNRQSKQDYTW